MFRSILVPLDGSEFAEEAIPPALSIAAHAGANLELLHAHELYALHESHACWSPYEPAEDADFRHQEQAYLQETTRRLQACSSVAVTSALVNGLVENAILRRVRTNPPDLIVMATHGRSPLSRLCRASLAEKLILGGQTPVLLVHPREKRGDRAPRSDFKRILISLDGTDPAERVLKPAAAIGKLMGADYTLVQAVDAGSLLDGFTTVAEPSAIEYGCKQRRAAAQAYLNQVAEGLRIEGASVRAQVVFRQSACRRDPRRCLRP